MIILNQLWESGGKRGPIIIPVSNIAFIEAPREYTLVHLRDGPQHRSPIIVEETFEEIKGILEQP